jgi:hypothetical protein
VLRLCGNIKLSQDFRKENPSWQLDMAHSLSPLVRTFPTDDPQEVAASLADFLEGFQGTISGDFTLVDLEDLGEAWSLWPEYENGSWRVEVGVAQEIPID